MVSGQATLERPVDIVFTEEQRALIEASESTYVEACPGAGKTQAIVQRFVERPAVGNSRRGVALLSFTNAAVDEARRRCAADLGLLQVPNFVGTIDAFINRFIVGPAYVAGAGRAATFRDTWSSVPGTRISVKGVQGIFALDWFDIALDGTATLIDSRIPPDRRAGITSLRPDQLKSVSTAAGAKWRSLTDRGVLDASTSRRLMATYLSDQAISMRLRELLASRFIEVIVDEVQDCTETDVVLLETLEGAGIRMICVGDPDQAIYGFRRSSASTSVPFLSRLAPGRRLSGNFRSSPAICLAVGSIRDGDASDVPMGKSATVGHPVIVASFRRASEVRPVVRSVLQDYGIPETDVIVLAHASATSRACAGNGSNLRSTDSRLVSFAIAVHRFQSADSSPPARREALRQFEKLVYELGDGEGSATEYLVARGLTERLFQERCLRIITGLKTPFGASPSQFKTDLSEALRSHEVLRCKTSMLRTPNGDQWPVLLGQDGDALLNATIHGFKGLQHRAVTLVLPRTQSASREDDGIEQWVSGRPGESRRVLYVGASRAKDLLILATHESRMDDVVDRLNRDQVPHFVHA